MSTIIHEAKLM